MDIILAVNLVSITALFILGGVVFYRRQNWMQNTFVWFSLSLGLWIGSNYLSNQTDNSHALLTAANHLTLAFALITLTLMLIFCFGLTNHKVQMFDRLLLWFGGLATILSATSWVIVAVTPQSGYSEITFGNLAIVYFLAVLLIVLRLIQLMITAYLHSRGMQRLRIQVVLASFILALILGFMFNAVLPFVTGSFVYTNIGPLAGTVGAAGIFYAVIKHKLFDLKMIVARSVAYAFVIVFMLGAYFTLGTWVAKQFLEINIGWGQQVYLVTIAATLALAYQPIKRFFDRLSDRIFFRDRYDPQEILDQFGDFLVSEVEVGKLINRTLEVLDFSVKPLKGFMLLYGKSGNRWYDMKGRLDSEAAATLNKTLEYQPETELLVDQTEDHEEVFINNLIEVLKNHGIAISIRMKAQDDLVGYMLLGDKKSGGIYRSQDLKFLNIMCNELAVALKNAQRFEEIQKFNETLKKEISDATEELRDSNKKLKALDEAKDEFISMASHQLRTPLTAVKGYISMVMDGDAGAIDDKQREMLQAAFTSSQRMVFQISDLLNVSRLKTGKFVIEYSVFDLAGVVKSEVAQLQDVATSRNVEIIFNKPDNIPFVKLDENKTRQVMMNFIDNAIYYTKSGGTIEVHLEADDKTIKYWVEDTGIGVPKRDQHRLFTKFFRAANAKQARPDGTGLGLFMAQKIIVAQGGAIIFKSVENQGSTFGFSFPRSKIASQ